MKSIVAWSPSTIETVVMKLLENMDVWEAKAFIAEFERQNRARR